ncbi:DNA primase [Neomicrococcus aestuarii]|uniref:DNA primase n=1 Tax=Neomicrococcus aestuarii TaxID=556325 RepID=A0A7W8TRF4_9MICC|nr:DNA primase [Neomicrococcus aestuarii]MBB5511524.1 DNA primase [Neomicrococcus aestuarii]
MAGLIKREDIDEVRARSDIKEVIEGYVTLRSAGIGSFKGLCPFHDERSPSFHVRPQVGTYHCFGCGESGDVISFVMKMDHTTFSETVERLAGRLGIELHYEDGGTGPSKQETGRRQRLLDAHKIAEEFFRAQLQDRRAVTAQRFLAGRGFDPAAAAQFGVGYAPQGWDALLKHLTGKGFTTEELQATGMFSEGQRGIYDRFRGRLIWPIRDLSGATIGFGARKLFDDDKGPKYLNTPETQLYKKSQVLYGVDLAKRAITKNRELVVVEGYTDVMACHLSGIDTAVATCGTAFGTDHIKIVRRLLSDDGTGGSVIFTFDGDAAGQKAALRAFDEDQRFLAQTYVAVEPNGLDPCDLRQERGATAVRELIDSKRPLFEFAIKASLKKFDLDTVEGRVNALRAAAPIVAAIRDHAMRPAYARELSSWLGMDLNEVNRAVHLASQQPRKLSDAADASSVVVREENEPAPNPGEAPRPLLEKPDARDPMVRMERESLEVVLQQPGLVTEAQWHAFYGSRFVAPAHTAIHEAIRTAAAAGTAAALWVEAIREAAPAELHNYVSELAVQPLPARNEDALARYCSDIMSRLQELQIRHRKEDLLGRLQRLDPTADGEKFTQLNRELFELELERRALHETDQS